jgi:hypothetical protein
MGQPVVHFEVMGDDADKLQTFYSDLFDWKINSDNPMNYGMVDREGNVNADGVGIGGGIGGSTEFPATSPSMSRSRTWRQRSRRRRASAGPRRWAQLAPPKASRSACSPTPTADWSA